MPAVGLGYVHCITTTHILRKATRPLVPFDVPKVKAQVQVYRSSTILNDSFNSTISRTFVPLVKTIYEVAGPAITVFTIKLWNGGAPAALVLLVAWLVVTCFVLAFAPIIPLAQTYAVSAALKKSLAVRVHVRRQQAGTYYTCGRLSVRAGS